jgi:hypothetical protein
VIGEAFPQVASRQTAPRNVGYITRDVIESSRVNVGLMSEGKKGYA